jgi:hypothetical protein
MWRAGDPYGRADELVATTSYLGSVRSGKSGGPGVRPGPADRALATIEVVTAHAGVIRPQRSPGRLVQVVPAPPGVIQPCNVAPIELVGRVP